MKNPESDKHEELVLTLYGGSRPEDKKILARFEVLVTVYESMTEIWCETEKEVEYVIDYEAYCNRATCSRPSFCKDAPWENNMDLGAPLLHATQEKALTIRFQKKLWRQFKMDSTLDSAPLDFVTCKACGRRYVKASNDNWIEFTNFDDPINVKAPHHECPAKD